MTLIIPDREIGGGRVRHGFRMGTEYLQAGTELTREQVLSIGAANRRSLIEQNKLGVYPISAPGAREHAETLERMVVSRGFGKFDVVEGRVLAAGVTKAAAHKMAGIDPKKH